MQKTGTDTVKQFNIYYTVQNIKVVFEMMRPKQWTKNLFLFAAVIFSLNLKNISMDIKVLFGFIAFCFLSSSVYILNDIVDAKKDRIHPEKRNRPIASGKLPVSSAIVLMAVLFLFSAIVAYNLSINFFYISILYFLMVCAYSFSLKNIVLVDVITIASGFVLRAWAGAVIIDVIVSPWLLLCTFLLALFIGFNKRRNELLTLKDNAGLHKKILGEYNLDLINQLVSICSSVTIMSYCLYTFTGSHSQNLMLTIPFVVYGLFRFQYLVSKKNMGESPEIILLKDKPLILNILLWIFSCIMVLYNN
jgi:4-hydroxybenzoate polyprenyltransferase